MDKIAKAIQKLSAVEQKVVKEILLKIKANTLIGFDLKKLKNQNDIYRVRKGRLRIIFHVTDTEIKILTIERRNDNTYNKY